MISPAKNCFLVIVALMSAAAVAQEQPVKLKVGDPAPKLMASKWVQGDPVKEFELDKVYLVEFWATWCGPCIASIPHVNELHKKFGPKGFVVIGQNVWEQKQEAVAPFVKKMGDKMTYRVALDTVTETEKGAMARTWMEAAGQNGIPASFLVDKSGAIAWIGHPMKLKDDLIEQLLAGKYDIKKAAIEHDQRQQAEARVDVLWRDYGQHLRANQFEQAESLLDQMEKLLPEEDRSNLGNTRFELLLRRNDFVRAYKLARELSDKHPKNSMMQNELAWSIATDEQIPDPERDLDLAEKIARRANETAEGSDAAILDTLARVLFMKGQKEAAIEFQQKAVALSDGRRQQQFQQVLDNYKQGRLEDPVVTLRRDLNRSIAARQWDKAASILKELEGQLPEEKRASLDTLRFRILLGRKDYQAAEKLADELCEQKKDNLMFQNQLAWDIAITPGVSAHELAIAEKIARRANEAAKSGNAEILDTLARVLYLKGETQPAIEFQHKAVELAKGRRKEQFQATLNSFKEGKVPKPY